MLVIAALVALDLEDYQPANLAPVVVMLAWFPLIALREAGHAIAAWVIGWEVEEIVVGFGRPAPSSLRSSLPCRALWFVLPTAVVWLTHRGGASWGVV